MSCKVLLSAWPICRLPVTFGGGITTQNGCADTRSGRPKRNASDASQSAEARPSAAAKSKDLSIMEFWSARCPTGAAAQDRMADLRAALKARAAKSARREGYKPIVTAEVNALSSRGGSPTS